jgi:hypothetical protein
MLTTVIMILMMPFVLGAAAMDVSGGNEGVTIGVILFTMLFNTGYCLYKAAGYAKEYMAK